MSARACSTTCTHAWRTPNIRGCCCNCDRAQCPCTGARFPKLSTIVLLDSQKPCVVRLRTCQDSMQSTCCDSVRCMSAVCPNVTAASAHVRLCSCYRPLSNVWSATLLVALLLSLVANAMKAATHLERVDLSQLLKCITLHRTKDGGGSAVV